MQLADLRIFTEPQQGASYDDLLAVARRAEALGFGAFFRSDHYLVMGDGDGLPGPTDAWITLAGLARETSTIRLGTLVTPVTFRSPGLLAISVAQVDQMSGGRVELGIGAGWYEAEHTAYSFDFPSDRGTLRLADRPAGDHRRAVAQPDRLDVQLRRHGPLGDRLARPAQAGADQAADRDGWRRQDQDAAAGGAVRDRVQPAVRPAVGVRQAVRPGARRVRCDRPDRADGLLGRTRRLCRARRGRVPRPGRGDRAGARRAAHQRRRRHRRGGRGARCASGTRPAPNASTSRCSTSTTSTTST